ncbi:MAG: Fe-S protein assembly co-chaperone HscB [Oxalobacter sp.]|nr:MAG: Fe-S protein assembly co-chaperone HscB [Oxalobacter sp.]
MQNHFDLFHLPQRFALDVTALDAAYRSVQGQVHPDRFAQASDAEKRVAMQWATQANEAYQTLKHPLKRAAYLCELNGIDLKVESNTAMPPAFLMQQMAWREALQEIQGTKDLSALETLSQDWRGVRKELMQQMESFLEVQSFEKAAESVRQWIFLEKFGEDLRNTADRIEN